MMVPRLELLRELLVDDGSIWMTIDDNEAHYLKVVMDEVFGRKNFAANCFWQKVYSERMDARGFSVSHDHLLVYRKSERFLPMQLLKEQNSAQFGYFDEAMQKSYRRRSLRKEGSESLRRDRPLCGIRSMLRMARRFGLRNQMGLEVAGVGRRKTFSHEQPSSISSQKMVGGRFTSSSILKKLLRATCNVLGKRRGWPQSRSEA